MQPLKKMIIVIDAPKIAPIVMNKDVKFVFMINIYLMKIALTNVQKPTIFKINNAKNAQKMPKFVLKIKYNNVNKDLFYIKINASKNAPILSFKKTKNV